MSTFSQPLTVHQYHHSTASYDAVTNHMLWIQSTLKEKGIAGEIFYSKNSNFSHPFLQTFKKSKLWSGDLLLIHHSQGNPDLKKILEIEIPKVLIYHNITPHSFFNHDPYLASLSRLGRAQLEVLKNEVCCAFGLSELNMEELKKTGFSKVEKLPLVNLLNFTPASPSSFSNETPIKLLFVGRFSSHKNQALLIKAFYFLKPLLPQHSKLILVGKGDLIYTLYLKLLTKSLDLQNNVQFLSNISDKQIETLYKEASAFICPSLHEGFCIPLVEAMRFSLPLFALPTLGVVETLGGAGLVFQTEDPKKIAYTIKEALFQKEVRESLKLASAKRFEDLKSFQNQEVLHEKIVGIAKTLRETPLFHKKPLDFLSPKPTEV